MYWVYIKHGEGGWYAEMNDEEMINIYQFQKIGSSPDETVSSFFAPVSEERRIPIK
jgi:hypothetical protein